MRFGEIHIAQTERHELRHLIGTRLRLAGLLCSDQPAIAICAERAQKPCHILEVMRRGGVADMGALGGGAEREAFQPVFRQFLLGGLQQKGRQIAFMVRLLRGHRHFRHPARFQT